MSHALGHTHVADRLLLNDSEMTMPLSICIFFCIRYYIIIIFGIMCWQYPISIYRLKSKHKHLPPLWLVSCIQIGKPSRVYLLVIFVIVVVDAMLGGAQIWAIHVVAAYINVRGLKRVRARGFVHIYMHVYEHGFCACALWNLGVLLICYTGITFCSIGKSIKCKAFMTVIWNRSSPLSGCRQLVYCEMLHTGAPSGTSSVANGSCFPSLRHLRN